MRRDFILSNGSKVTFFEKVLTSNAGNIEKSNLMSDDFCYEFFGVYRWKDKPYYEYQFQNSRIDAINRAIEYRMNELKTQFQVEHDILRVSKNFKEEFTNFCNNDSTIQNMNELYELINKVRD